MYILRWTLLSLKCDWGQISSHNKTFKWFSFLLYRVFWKPHSILEHKKMYMQYLEVQRLCVDMPYCGKIKIKRLKKRAIRNNWWKQPSPTSWHHPTKSRKGWQIGLLPMHGFCWEDTFQHFLESLMCVVVSLINRKNPASRSQENSGPENDVTQGCCQELFKQLLFQVIRNQSHDQKHRVLLADKQCCSKWQSHFLTRCRWLRVSTCII